MVLFLQNVLPTQSHNGREILDRQSLNRCIRREGIYVTFHTPLSMVILAIQTILHFTAKRLNISIFF